MKNIFKTLALALPLALPLASTSLMASTTGDHDFEGMLAEHGDAVVLSVVRYHGAEDALQARVKAVHGDEKIIKALPVDGALTDAGWKNDDENLTAKQTFIGNVEVGRDDFLRVAAPYNTDAVAYTSVAATEEQDAELTVGSIVTVSVVDNWDRPDGTTYSRVGVALFRLRLEETRDVVPGEFKILRGVRQEVKARGFNTKMGDRHTIDNYAQTQVICTTTKFAVDSDTVIGEPTVVEYIALARTGSYESWENESGRGQGNIPEGYKING